MAYLLRGVPMRAGLLRSSQSLRALAPLVSWPAAAPARRGYAAHQTEESYEEFNERYLELTCSLFPEADADRYEKFFYGANDKFEVQRGLNNVFAYDLVPSVKVIESALRACRRGKSHSPHVIPMIAWMELMKSSCGLQHIS
jgi:cytochrome c oxidase subunit 5a